MGAIETINPLLTSQETAASWTPTAVLTSGTATLDPAFTWGSYTRAGLLICMQCTIAIASVAAPTGQFNIDGFPPALAPIQHTESAVLTCFASGAWPAAVTSELVARVLNTTTPGRIRINFWSAGALQALGPQLAAGQFVQITGVWSLTPTLP